MKIFKLFIPFAILIIILTLRVSSYLNQEQYYEDLKERFKEELDIISLSKKFLGKLQLSYFESDFVVSTEDDKHLIDDNTYLVYTQSDILISPCNAVCVDISKSNGVYSLKLSADGVMITYYDVIKPKIKLYEYVKAGEVICNLNFNNYYYYKVLYEN